MWDSLACLDATYPILHALNLQCAVSSVILDMELYPRDLGYVTRLLAPMNPQHLRIHESSLGLPTMQHLILLVGSLKELQRLDVTVDLAVVEDDDGVVNVTVRFCLLQSTLSHSLETQPSEFADALGNVAAATDIQMLDCLIVDIDCSRPLHEQPDVHDLARRITKSSNKLSSVKIQLFTENPTQRYYGTVSRVDGEQRMTEVADLISISAIDANYLPQQMPVSVCLSCILHLSDETAVARLAMSVL